MSTPRRPLFGRVLRLLGWMTASVVVVLVGLYLLRGVLFRERVARALGEILSKELGARVTVEGVEGNYFTGLELVGVKAAQAPPFERLEIARLAVTYPFLGILGQDPLRSIRSFVATGVDLDVDTTKAGESQRGQPFSLNDLPSPLPEVSLDGRVAFRTGDGTFRAEHFAISGAGTRLKLLLDPLMVPEAWKFEPTRIEASLERQGPDRVAWSSPSALGGIELFAATLVERERGLFELSYELGVAGGKATGTVHPATVAFDLRDVDLAKLPAWVRALVKDPKVIPSLGSVNARGTLDQWAEASRGLAAEVTASGLTWAGIPVRSLKASAAWAGRRIDVATMQADVTGTSISGEGIVLDPSDSLVVVAVRAARAQGPDLGGFSAALGITGDPAELPAGLAFDLRLSRVEGAVVTVERFSVDHPEAVAEATGTVALGAHWNEWRDFGLAASVTARSKAPSTRALREGVSVAADGVVVRGEVAGTIGRPTGTFEANGARVTIGGVPLDRVTASGTVAWPTIVVKTLEAVAGEDVAKASGTLDLEKKEARNVAFDVTLARLSTLQRVFPNLPDLRGRGAATGTVSSATLDAAQVDAAVVARAVRVGKLELGSVDAKVHLAGRLLGVESLKVSGHYGEVDAAGTLRLDDVVASAADFAFSVRAPNVTALGDLWDGFGRAKGSLRAKGRVVKPAGAPISRSSWTANLHGDDLELDAWKIGSASAAMKLDWPALILTSLDAGGPMGRASGDAVFDLESGSLRTAALDVDAALEAGALHLEAGVPTISGPVRVKGRVEKREGSDWKAFRGDVELSGDRVIVEGREVRDFHARVASAGDAIQIADVSGALGGAQLTAGGTFVPVPGGADVVIQRLAADLDDGRSIELQKPVGIHWREGSLAVERFELTGLEGRLSGEATLGERVAIALEARAVDLGLVLPDTSGRIDLDLTASGTAERLTLSGSLRAPDLSFRGQKGSLLATFRQDERELVLEKLAIDAGDLLKLEGSGRLPALSLRSGRPVFGPLADAAFKLHGTTSGAEAWKRLGIKAPSRLSDLALDVEATGPKLSVRASAQLAVRRARDDAAAVDVPIALEGRIGPEGALVDISAGGGEVPLATARAESALSYDWTQLARMLEQGADLELGGKFDAALADSAPLAPFFPELRHLGGKMHVHADLAGTLGKPELTGFAELDEFSIRFEADAPGLDDVVARLKLEGRTVTIEKLEGKTGYSPFSLSGKATFETVKRPVLDVALKGTNVLIARDDDLRLRADLDTTLKGPLDAMRLGGKARVTDAVWSQAMDLGGATPEAPPKPGDKSQQVFRFRDPPFSTAKFDVEITADSTVRVDNNLVKATMSAALTLVGSGEAPRVEGRISTERALVRLPFTRLDVERAEIVFRPADEYRPRLDAVATTRLKGHELTVHVSGILPDVDVKVATLPPLSQRDAYLLLTTGITPAEIQREGVAAATLYRAGSFYGSELLSQFSNASDETALERFSLEIGRDQSPDGRPTVDVEAPLSERFFLHGQRDRFDDYNAGIIWRLRFR